MELYNLVILEPADFFSCCCPLLMAEKFDGLVACHVIRRALYIPSVGFQPSTVPRSSIHARIDRNSTCPKGPPNLAKTIVVSGFFRQCFLQVCIDLKCFCQAFQK